MQAENTVLKKDLYHHPQIPDFLKVKEYIVFRKDKQNFLVQRFVNEASFFITSVTFTLFQIDSCGNVINKKKICYDGIKVYPGALFVPKKPIALDSNCADYSIIFNKVISEDYLYIVKGKDFKVYYKKNSKSSGGAKNTTASKPYHIPSKKAIISAVVTIVLIAAFCVLGALYSAFKYKYPNMSPIEWVVREFSR